MKRSSPFIAAAFLLFLASCSSTGFVKRKYLPGHFFNAPVSMNGNSVAHGNDVIVNTVQPQPENFSGELKEQTTSPTVMPKDEGWKDLLVLTKTIRSTGALNVIKKELGIHTRQSLITHKNRSSMLMGNGKRKATGWLSLICGILTFYSLLLSSLVFALLAILFGMMTFHRIHTDSSKYGGKGLAFLGMFLGILGLTLILLGVIIFAL